MMFAVLVRREAKMATGLAGYLSIRASEEGGLAHIIHDGSSRIMRVYSIEIDHRFARAEIENTGLLSADVSKMHQIGRIDASNENQFRYFSDLSSTSLSFYNFVSRSALADCLAHGAQ
jgi:hypothetical protein